MSPRLDHLRRWCLRLALAAVLALSIGYLPYRAYGPGGVARVLRLEGDLKRLEENNRHLREQNGKLRQQINGLKDDSGAIEAVARDELGLVRPEDIVFQFE
jgi:cell division protein FtsB